MAAHWNSFKQCFYGVFFTNKFIQFTRTLTKHMNWTVSRAYLPWILIGRNFEWAQCRHPIEFSAINFCIVHNGCTGWQTVALDAKPFGSFVSQAINHIFTEKVFFGQFIASYTGRSANFCSTFSYEICIFFIFWIILAMTAKENCLLGIVNFTHPHWIFV